MTGAALTRPLDHYCGVCRYALERFRELGKPDRFEHTHAAESFNGPAHAPVPMPLAELLQVNMVCDICSATDPVWAYRFTNVRLRSQRGVEDLGEWWAICARCASVVEARDVQHMLARAAVPFINKGQPHPHLATTLGPIYRRLLARPFERLTLREVRW